MNAKSHGATPKTFVAAFGIILCGAAPNSVSAASVAINPSKDNTLYEYVVADGDRSNGVGGRFFSGKTAESHIRRGVLAFSIAGNIPAGSTITSVSLSLNMSRTNASTPRPVELHKLLADWGEGTSDASANEGKGAPATVNDATWRHRFYSTVLWATQGGVFSSTVSASQAVGAVGLYTWSSAQMVADVQSWLDTPVNNFGWLVLGDESVSTTAKRFDSRESSNPPVLTIQYTFSTPSPTPTPAGTVSPPPTPTATSTATATAVITPTPTPSTTPFSHPLFVPPASGDANVSVSIEAACIQILDGPCTNMWTYGGTYPGLTIRRPTGQTTHVTFTNNLDPGAGAMTVHNHGNHSSWENDGQTDDLLILSGGSRTYTYDGLDDGSNERGTIQFYHDHRMDVTGRNVWFGLAGLYIIDDPADPANLPSGAFELPLAIADRQFDANNQIPYVFNAMGVTGDKILINGVYQPYVDVGDRKYRLRILNASNARIYNLTLSSGDAFTQIGTESGLLPAPVVRTQMRMGPAERLDVVVDFAPRLGQNLYLMDTLTGTQLVKFRVTQHLTDSSTIPSVLRPLPDIGEPTITRNFSFDRTSGHWTINGLRFDPNRIDAQPVLGTTEKWVFTNPTGAPHTVHLHDVDQQCVSRNGGPCYTYETMKETWYLGPGETLELKLKFTDHTGKYVFHCHMIEHEDDGMMAQFEVVGPGTSPTPTPFSISGTVYYCSNPAHNVVPNVTLSLTGGATTSTMSDSSGNYLFSSLVAGGSYAVTPSKSTLAPGSQGINTVDVLAAQRHFLNIALLPPGCLLTAADVNHSGMVDTVDVVGIQRFFLGLTTGIASVGEYQFTPPSRTYLNLTNNQGGQNYDTLIFGDITSPFAQ